MVQTSFSAVVKITRPADTNAYTAVDVVGRNTGGGGGSLEFANMGPRAGGRIMITDISLEIDVTAVPSGMTNFFLECYARRPASSFGDNAAWSMVAADRDDWIGTIDLGYPVLQQVGATVLLAPNRGVNKVLDLLSDKFHAYLVTVTGYTPTSAATKVIRAASILL